MLDTLVGIPTYNGSYRVDWLLQSISMRTVKDINYKIVICDDSGKKEHQEKTKSVVDKWKNYLPVELLINDKNIGVSSSWNRLAKCQDSRNVILINDDVIVAKDWLENMTYFLDNNPNVGAVCYHCHKMNKMSENDVPRLLNSPIITETSILDNEPMRMLAIGGSGCGCFFGFRKEKYDIVGGFDENYFALREETDFYTALLSRGYPIYKLYCPRSWHMVSRTFKTASEINVKVIYPKSIQHYHKKWRDHPPIVQNRFLDKIPFQKIKWMCNNKIYEDQDTDIQSFVNIGYRDILKRDPDPSEFRYYVDQMSLGKITKYGFLRALRTSREYKTKFGQRDIQSS